MDILKNNYDLPHSAFKVLAYLVMTYKTDWQSQYVDNILVRLNMSKGTYYKALNILEERGLINRGYHYTGSIRVNSAGV